MNFRFDLSPSGELNGEPEIAFKNDFLTSNGNYDTRGSNIVSIISMNAALDNSVLLCKRDHDSDDNIQMRLHITSPAISMMQA